MAWYCLRVLTRQEAFAVTALSEAGLIGYAPEHVTWAKHAKRKATRTRPLIPGYVLALLPDDEAIHSALSIRGVFEIVSHDGKPQRIPSIHVGALVLADAYHLFDETWEPPKPKGRRYSHRWKMGDRVEIGAGPFAGHVGIVKRSHNKARMDVELMIFGRVQEVVVEHRALVKPAEAGRMAA